MVYICYVFFCLAYFIVEYQQSVDDFLIVVDVFNKFSRISSDTFNLIRVFYYSAYRLDDFCRIVGDDDVVVFGILNAFCAYHCRDDGLSHCHRLYDFDSDAAAGKEWHYRDVVFADKKGKDGIIHISPFTCMPEIMSQNIFPSMRTEHEIPILALIMDEQTGKAGYITRLEAFVDLMRRKKRAKLAKNKTRI